MKHFFPIRLIRGSAYTRLYMEILVVVHETDRLSGVNPMPGSELSQPQMNTSFSFHETLLYRGYSDTLLKLKYRKGNK